MAHLKISGAAEMDLDPQDLPLTVWLFALLRVILKTMNEQRRTGAITMDDVKTAKMQAAAEAMKCRGLRKRQIRSAEALIWLEIQNQVGKLRLNR